MNIERIRWVARALFYGPWFVILGVLIAMKACQ